MRSTPPVCNADTENVFRPEDLLIRPATLSDIEDFHELARLAGVGFTSLPANEAMLAKRLITSERAFAGEPGTLMLALEDRRQRRVVGCAAVKPGGAPRPDFLNFFVQGQDLEPTSRYDDMTEVGSLLLHPDYRRNGIGPFLARSRYLLIATDQKRFGSQIFSELRGVVDENDCSPFYDAVCAPFFGCSFAEADDLCAHGRQNEINRLLPRDPIALATLSRTALTAMGQPHRAGRRALDYLEEEGFRFEGVVDLLDGGPAVVAETRSIGTIRDSFGAPLRVDAVDEEVAREAYISVGSGLDFRCCRAGMSIKDDAVVCTLSTIDNLGSRDEAIGQIRLLNHGNGVSDRYRPVATSLEPMANAETGPG
ncbi:MAG: arginine N-succinyltransferase [Geminicoccaceae bacterium]